MLGRLVGIEIATGVRKTGADVADYRRRVRAEIRGLYEDLLDLPPIIFIVCSVLALTLACMVAFRPPPAFIAVPALLVVIAARLARRL